MLVMSKRHGFNSRQATRSFWIGKINDIQSAVWRQQEVSSMLYVHEGWCQERQPTINTSVLSNCRWDQLLYLAEVVMCFRNDVKGSRLIIFRYGIVNLLGFYHWIYAIGKIISHLKEILTSLLIAVQFDRSIQFTGDWIHSKSKFTCHVGIRFT